MEDKGKRTMMGIIAAIIIVIALVVIGLQWGKQQKRSSRSCRPNAPRGLEEEQEHRPALPHLRHPGNSTCLNRTGRGISRPDKGVSGSR